MINKNINELKKEDIDSIVSQKKKIGLMSIFLYDFGIDKKLMKQNNSFKDYLLYTCLFLIICLAGIIGLIVNTFTTNVVVNVLSIIAICASVLILCIREIVGIIRGVKILNEDNDAFIKRINEEYYLDCVKNNSGLSLTLKRQIIFYKNHIDIFALIFAALAMIVFTFAIYVYTPLNVLIIQPRWPWAQAESDPDVPFTMIQFFAFLFSMLGTLCLLNYRSSRKKLYAVGFYSLSAIQLINDIYYLSEIYRHLNGNVYIGDQLYNRLTMEYPGGAGIAFTIIHIILVAISIIILVLSPLIQKYTKRIKLSSSMQDKEIESNGEVILESENEKNEYGYNLNDIDDDLCREVLGNNFKEIIEDKNNIEEVVEKENTKLVKLNVTLYVINQKK